MKTIITLHISKCQAVLPVHPNEPDFTLLMIGVLLEIHKSWSAYLINVIKFYADLIFETQSWIIH
jgi:hypothetical protein